MNNALKNLTFIFLIGCEAQVQKNNFRTANTTTESATPTTSASQAGADSTISPSSGDSTQSSSQPSTATSTPVTPVTSMTPSPLPSLSITPTSSPSPSASGSSSSDQQAPIPGNSGDINASNISSTDLDLAWDTATDNKTSSNQLQYLVYKSTSNNLGTISTTEANGTALGSYVPDVMGKTISELNTGTTYYFTVIVKDAAGNKAIYSTVSATTLDVTGPVAGNSGTIASSNIATTSIDLSWTAATDLITPSAQLQYLVYRSTINNLTTASDTEINGTAVGSFAPNITSKSITGLISSRTYYFNVIVKDAAGNKSAYAMQTASTLDIIAPSAGNSGVMSSSV